MNNSDMINYVKSYIEYINESAQPKNGGILGLEKILKLPQGSGVFQDVVYDSKSATLTITQPKNMNPLDSGAVMSAIEQEKAALKKQYIGLKTIAIGDIKISVK